MATKRRVSFASRALLSGSDVGVFNFICDRLGEYYILWREVTLAITTDSPIC